MFVNDAEIINANTKQNELMKIKNLNGDHFCWSTITIPCHILSQILFPSLHLSVNISGFHIIKPKSFFIFPLLLADKFPERMQAHYTEDLIMLQIAVYS